MKRSQEMGSWRPISRPWPERRLTWTTPTTWGCAALGFGGAGLASYIALASEQVNGSAVLVVLLLGVLLPALLVATFARETPAYRALATLYGSLAVLLVIVGVWTVRIVKAILSTNFFFA